MASTAVYAWLSPFSGELQLGDLAFVQIFKGASEQPEGVFLMGKSEPGKLASLLKGAQGLEAKVVAPRELAAVAAEQLSSLGVKVRKLVQRDGIISLRYDHSLGKIYIASTEPPKKKRIKVLIVDDSPTIRKLLEKIISTDPELEVVGSVGLPRRWKAP